jgi:uncharacterized protein (DUF983 family)
MTEEAARAVSPIRAGLACRCPRCGEGKLFKGVLGIAPSCAVCGLDLAAHDNGDGPAVFVVLILGAIVVAAALIVEVKLTPPFWVHAVLWLPLILGGSIGLLRPFKGIFFAINYRHRIEK